MSDEKIITFNYSEIELRVLAGVPEEARGLTALAEHFVGSAGSVTGRIKTEKLPIHYFDRNGKARRFPDD